VWQIKGFKSNDFGSAANKGVTGAFSGSVASKGLAEISEWPRRRGSAVRSQKSGKLTIINVAKY
jgi:hypothetical protein